MMSEADWNWLGGFFDGEGSCGCYLQRSKTKRGKVREYWALRASVAQTDNRILYEIQARLGYGAVLNNQWRVSSATARKFLAQLRPYVRNPLKQEQVDKALKEDREKVCPIQKPSEKLWKELLSTRVGT